MSKKLETVGTCLIKLVEFDLKSFNKQVGISIENIEKER